MARLRWAVLCQEAILDKYSNNISLISITEQLNVSVVPTVFPQLFNIVCYWDRDARIEEEEVVNYKIILWEPAIKDQLVIDGQVVFESGKKRMRAFTRLLGIPIEKAGEYNILVEKKNAEQWENVAKIPIEIKVTS
jgi:hypothetical protein